MNTIKLGYKPESDYCGDCTLKESMRCCLFKEMLHLDPILDCPFDFNPTLRCQPCKDSEQAAKQMIPREEVGRLIDEYVEEMCVGRISMLQGSETPRGQRERFIQEASESQFAKHIKELLNQTKATNE